MHPVTPRSFGRIPSATGGIARLALAQLRKLGKDPRPVMSGAGLTVQEADDPGTRLEVRTEIKVLEIAARELQDEFFGFHLAHDFDLRELGLVYYVMASSADLADALRNCERYSKINNEGVRLRFSLGRTATIGLDYISVDRSSDRHHFEFWLVTLVRICRQMTDNTLTPHKLRVRHFRDEPPVEFKIFFGADVEFGADADEITFPLSAASLPIVGRDNYLNKLLRRYADEALASRPKERASIRSNVERIIVQLLPHGRANASEVARQLGMSSRTLSRKLRDEDVTYADMLEKLRAALAKRYLSDHELPVSEIAWLLGYRETSSLTNAFRRWTGTTPRQFRSSECRRRKANRPPARFKKDGRQGTEW
ncbi:AraC family transcriptional regulator ligand-binding domain-containing protein [Bradyrhizobium sp. STM 3843]|uniref:AraC family transcriptional regulator n=1 Tax=Bradyrhizobium sp. STM 3843 TaxID=551947 RepID=UPI0011119594|nr:AraC family transcriptional regulator ligand-binding domain-containing protein [Bradyrhizobium sp. STM 3843]